MRATKSVVLLAAVLGMSACTEIGPDKTLDRGIDDKHLSQLVAGIWIDPEGCDHWIIDDGVEGYLSGRLDDYGKPICSGAGLPNTAVGPFKSGSFIVDPL
ncbi:hypothetical protein [Phaeovulum sp.]|uniref:hypothetical protein n=1 Tax=Phaeovulum sp. TaxID=2934796 RepID=UPI00273018BC|nr:hypothetical protein [Phaeovulum sp.]MDP1670044.1 hypothetical protein [Phaeovulum sp.]MDP2061744.1 hypothetical protein [Phaeovulum sp.]MDP3862335.1 hypothetical protein [Phaeovulum sp.]MDZ4119327.1 hypothetical protein [Phaeovulum sp.]